MFDEMFVGFIVDMIVDLILSVIGCKFWYGVIVVIVLFFIFLGVVDFDCYVEYVVWFVENGCDGVVFNGFFGEY